MRVAVAIFGLLALGGCAAEAPLQEAAGLVSQHGQCRRQGGSGVAAASMISGYRQNNGLGAVVVDPALMKLAE